MMKDINDKMHEVANLFKDNSEDIRQVQGDFGGIVVIIQDMRPNGSS